MADEIITTEPAIQPDLNSYVHRCMIVSAEIRDIAVQMADQMGPSASGMWTTPLGATHDATPTHYISAGMITYEFAMMLSSPDYLLAACNMIGVPADLPTCTWLLSNADITEDNPWVAMERLGLVIVTTGWDIGSISTGKPAGNLNLSGKGAV